MRKVQVLTDSCSDLTPALMEKYGIDYCQMSTVSQGKTAPADLAWTKEEAHAFYDRMRGGERITTTQVPVEEFNRVFRKYLEAGCDIVYVGCASKQSGSVNTAAVLAKKLKEEFPDAEIYSVDAMRASAGEGMLAIEAAKFAAQGLSAKEVTEKTEAIRNNVRQFIAVHSLEYMRRAGRVKASAAFFGNLMGVKPILVATADGTQTSVKKVKGRAASLAEIVNSTKEVIEHPEDQTLYLVHADCSREEIDAVTEMIRGAIPCKEVFPLMIGPIIGASIGPEAIGIFSFGKEQTYKVAE